MAIRPVNPTPEFRSGRNADLLTPQRLSNFLDSVPGWTLHSRRSFDETWLLEPAHSRRRVVVHIPTDSNDVDYGRRLVEAIEEIASATQQSVDDLTLNALSVEKDRVGLKTSPPGSQSALSPIRVLGLLQGLIEFLAHVSESSEAGRWIGESLGAPPGEAVATSCEVLEAGRETVLAVPVDSSKWGFASGADPKVGSYGKNAGPWRELTLTALRALQTVREDLRHGVDLNLWTPIENEDDRQRRAAVTTLLESIVTLGSDTVEFTFAWHQSVPEGQTEVVRVEFGRAETRYLSLARERYG